MLKIRLMRIGAKKRPFYRIVVVEERSKRTGGYVELLGIYNPLTEPKDIKLRQDRIDYWVKMGAQPSVGFLRITGKAPQRLPRKPKKEKKNPVDSSKKEEAPATAAPAPESPAAETTPTAEEQPQAEETPKQEEQPVEETVSEEIKTEEPTLTEDKQPPQENK